MLTRLRPRRLLLHKKEIDRLDGQLSVKGMALLPLQIYFTKSFAKVQLGLGKGKTASRQARDASSARPPSARPIAPSPMRAAAACRRSVPLTNFALEGRAGSAGADREIISCYSCDWA